MSPATQQTAAPARSTPDSQLPSQRGRRGRRLFLYGLLALIVFTVAALGWLVGTAAGAQTLVSQILPRLPVDLTVDEVRGRLLGPLQLNGIRFRSQSLEARVASLSMDWQPTQLLSSKLQLRHLRLQGVDLQILPDPAPASREPIRLPQSIVAPVDLVVDELTVNDVQLLQGENNIKIRQAQVVFTWQGDRVTVSRLDVGAEKFSVTANGAATLADRYPLQLSVAPQGVLAGFAPAVGKLELFGTLQDLGVDLVVAPPYGLSLNGNVTSVLQKPAVDLELSLAPAPLDQLNADLPAARVVGTLSAVGPVDAMSVTGKARFQSAAQVSVEAKWQALIASTSAQLQQFDVGLADQPQPLSITGTLDWQDGLQAQLLAQADRWLLPFGQQPTYLNRLHLTASGNLTGYELHGTTGWEFADQLTPIRLDGLGNREQFTLEALRFGMSNTDPLAQLLLSGAIHWSAGLDGQFQLQGRGIDPARFVAQPKGSVRLDARIDVHGDPGTSPTVTVTELTLVVSLLVNPCRVQAALGFRVATLLWTSCNLSWPLCGCRRMVVLLRTTTCALLLRHHGWLCLGMF